MIGSSNLQVILFTPQTITPCIIKALEVKHTIILLLFPEGKGREGIKDILKDYVESYPNSHPQLLTYVEGDVDYAEIIHSQFEARLEGGDMPFVDREGNLK